ncbi:Y14A [Symbiodinium sp. CCMP2456]|nr:Y14A [Symbiodinium sp. CCMP2456]
MAVGAEKPARSREGWGLFISGLPGEVEDDDLEEAFRPFGTIVSLHLPLNRMTGETKGYCMLEYATFEEASAALGAMHGRDMKGSCMKVAWLCKEDGDDPGRAKKPARSRSPRKDA